MTRKTLVNLNSELDTTVFDMTLIEFSELLNELDPFIIRSTTEYLQAVVIDSKESCFHPWFKKFGIETRHGEFRSPQFYSKPSKGEEGEEWKAQS